MLPKKPIKKALKQESELPQVSTEAVVETRNILERLLHQMGVQAAQAFEQLNEGREQRGLRKLKRLNAWAVQKAAEKLFRAAEHNEMGLQPGTIVSPGGTNMSAQTETAKTRKEKGSAAEADHGV